MPATQVAAKAGPTHQRSRPPTSSRHDPRAGAQDPAQTVAISTGAIPTGIRPVLGRSSRCLAVEAELERFGHHIERRDVAPGITPVDSLGIAARSFTGTPNAKI